MSVQNLEEVGGCGLEGSLCENECVGIVILRPESRKCLKAEEFL